MSVCVCVCLERKLNGIAGHCIDIDKTLVTRASHLVYDRNDAPQKLNKTKNMCQNVSSIIRDMFKSR